MIFFIIVFYSLKNFNSFFNCRFFNQNSLKVMVKVGKNKKKILEYNL